MRITRIDAPRCPGGERPTWDRTSGTLYYIDNSGQKVHSYDRALGVTRTQGLPEHRFAG